MKTKQTRGLSIGLLARSERVLKNKYILHFAFSFVFVIFFLYTLEMVISLDSISPYLIFPSYLLIILATYYYLTTYFGFWKTLINYLLNFIFFIFEMLKINDSFHDTFNTYIFFGIGAIMLTINKLVLDILILYPIKEQNRLEIFLNKIAKYI